MPYDAKCEVFSFGIVLLELLTGLLQNSEDISGQPVILEDVLEENGSLLADVRAGEWPEEFTKEFLQLARECTAPYKKRTASMMSVMHSLVAIRNKYIVPSPLEVSLLARTKALIVQLETLQLHQDIIDTRKVELTYKCECCFDEYVDANKGVLCSNIEHSHFICGSASNDCFSHTVIDQANNQTAFLNNGNYIVCAYCVALDPSVVMPFDVSRVAKHANSVALTAFNRAVSNSVSAVPVCTICLDAPRVIALLPCGHKAYCEACFADFRLGGVSKCPFCRTDVAGTTRVFD
jgi:hypothetical protein